MPRVWNDLLGKPGIKILQDTEMFNFSLDSILLANFVNITKRCKNICDLCCGNAPIPMYLTLKTKANIVGVEIQEESFELANLSIEENQMNEQIKMINSDLKGISSILGKSKFDIVTCNPPYYKLGDFRVNPNDKKAIARHEISATLDDIVKEASLLLNSGGDFVMVHRPTRLVEILEVLKQYHLEPKRLQFIHAKVDSEATSILIEAKKDGNSGLRILKPLYVYDENGKWFSDIIKIYNGE